MGCTHLVVAREEIDIDSCSINGKHRYGKVRVL